MPEGACGLPQAPFVSKKFPGTDGKSVPGFFRWEEKSVPGKMAKERQRNRYSFIEFDNRYCMLS